MCHSLLCSQDAVLAFRLSCEFFPLSLGFLLIFLKILFEFIPSGLLYFSNLFFFPSPPFWISSHLQVVLLISVRRHNTNFYFYLKLSELWQQSLMLVSLNERCFFFLFFNPLFIWLFWVWFGFFLLKNSVWRKKQQFLKYTS